VWIENESEFRRLFGEGKEKIDGEERGCFPEAEGKEQSTSPEPGPLLVLKRGREAEEIEEDKKGEESLCFGESKGEMGGSGNKAPIIRYFYRRGPYSWGGGSSEQKSKMAET